MGNFNARLQLIVVALFLAVIPSLADNVAQGVCGTGVNWCLDDQGVLTIGGEGEMQLCLHGILGRAKSKEL